MEGRDEDSRRPKRKAARKLLYPSEVPVSETLSAAAKKREYNRIYQERLKASPRYETFKKEQAVKKKQYRSQLTPDERKSSNEKARLRMVAYRARLKEQNTHSSSIPASKTRADAKQYEMRRERNRLSQQKRRQGMSAQKQRREREKARARYHQKKLERQATSSKALEVHLLLSTCLKICPRQLSHQLFTA